MNTCIGSSSSTIRYRHEGISPFLNLALRVKLVKTCVSHTLPGHFMTTYINRQLQSQQAGTLIVKRLILLTKSVALLLGCIILIWVPPTAPKHCGKSYWLQNITIFFFTSASVLGTCSLINCAPKSRPGEAFRPVRPWPELKSAFLSVARQTSVIRMAVAKVAMQCSWPWRFAEPASFIQLSEPEIWPIEASILECSTSLV